MTDINRKRQEILDEHKRIHATILEIESSLDQLCERPARPGESWELPGLVESLRDQFKRHFELEESGGLLGPDTERHDPETRRTVDDLIAEHRIFEREVERILGEFDFSFVPGKTVQICFDGDLRELISRLAVHEAAENALLEKLLAADEERALPDR